MCSKKSQPSAPLELTEPSSDMYVGQTTATAASSSLESAPAANMHLLFHIHTSHFPTLSLDPFSVYRCSLEINFCPIAQSHSIN